VESGDRSGETRSKTPGTSGAVVPVSGEPPAVEPHKRLPRREEVAGAARLARREPTVEMWSPPMPKAQRTHPEVGDPILGTVSVGTVATGHLVNGRALPHAGPHFVVLDEHRGRATNYATDEMAQVLAEAAEAVALAYPDAVMGVGNVSRSGGGDIPWSISHNCGRDADLGFYLLDDNGEQVLLPTLALLTPPLGTIEFEGRTLTFDPARNWTLVKALLDSKVAEVQYIFCADFLVQRMLDYAASQGVNARYLASLSGLLRQPRGTLPHDDHLHVRITCSDEDLAEGCRNIVGGRERTPASHSGYARRVKELFRILSDEKSLERRSAALRLLALLKVRHGQGKIYEALGDCEEPVCGAGVAALEAVEAKVRPGALVAVIKGTNDPDTVATAFRLLRRGGSGAVRKVLPLLKDQRRLVRPHYFFEKSVIVRQQACYCLGWLGSKKVVKALLALLAEDDDAAVRGAALWAVRAIAGASVFPDDVVDTRPTNLRKRWKRWARKHKEAGKALRRELRDLGYKVDKMDRKEIRELVRAVRDNADHVSMNSQRLLNKLLKKRIPINIKDRAHSHWLWRKQLKRLKRKGR